MELIDRETLKQKLDCKDNFKLVMVLGDDAFRAMHIPGSLHFSDIEEAMRELSPEDEIVVYCSGPTCLASATAYHFLVGRGYPHVKRYAGGLEMWHQAGFPLEGEMVKA